MTLGIFELKIVQEFDGVIELECMWYYFGSYISCHVSRSDDHIIIACKLFYNTNQLEIFGKA